MHNSIEILNQIQVYLLDKRDKIQNENLLDILFLGNKDKLKKFSFTKIFYLYIVLKEKYKKNVLSFSFPSFVFIC